MTAELMAARHLMAASGALIDAAGALVDIGTPRAGQIAKELMGMIKVLRRFELEQRRESARPECSGTVFPAA